MRRKPEQVRLEARLRVETVWHCIGVLRPDLDPSGKQILAREVLRVAERFDPAATGPLRPQITPAQVTEIVWANSQCIQRSCPMLLFSDRIAEELNAFFHPID